MNKYFIIVGALLLQAVLSQVASSQARSNRQQGNHALDIRQSILEQTQQRILVAAHRGAHNLVPENSVASVEEAVRLGVDIVEIDVELTKDNKLVLMHDDTVDRTTNGIGKVADLSLEQIRMLRLKNRQGKLTHHKVPTLREVLLVSKGEVFVDLDMKSGSKKTLLLVAELVNDLGMNQQVAAFSSSLTVLKRFRASIPGSLILPLGEDHQDAIRLTKSCQLKMVHLKPQYLSSQLMAELDELNTSGWVNALGQADQQAINGDLSGYNKLINYQVDIIQTDQPALLIDYLKKLGLRPSH